MNNLTTLTSLSTIKTSFHHVGNSDSFLHKYFAGAFGMGFFQSFVSAFSLIFVSEIGDKTFFIAAIFAMKSSRFVVFCGALMALILMTVLSAFLGYASTIIPKWIVRYICSFLFFIFGLKMFSEAYSMGPNEGMKDFESVQLELEEKQLLNSSGVPSKGSLDVDTETGTTRVSRRQTDLFFALFSSIFVQSFILTFLAEWGDRSQLSTIILAAKNNFVGVMFGGVCGHALCTGMAVLGGRFVAQRVSLRTVHYIGGVVFMVSAACTLILE